MKHTPGRRDVFGKRRLRSQERFMLCLMVVMFALAAVMLVVATLQGCGTAKADSVTIQSMVGPSGASCFVFYNGTTPFAGDCH